MDATLDEWKMRAAAARAAGQPHLPQQFFVPSPDGDLLVGDDDDGGGVNGGVGVIVGGSSPPDGGALGRVTSATPAPALRSSRHSASPGAATPSAASSLGFRQPLLEPATPHELTLRAVASDGEDDTDGEEGWHTPKSSFSRANSQHSGTLPELEAFYDVNGTTPTASPARQPSLEPPAPAPAALKQLPTIDERQACCSCCVIC